MRKNTVGLMRILCVVFVGLSFAIAAFKPKEIITLMSFSWGTLAGTFFRPVFVGIVFKEDNAYRSLVGYGSRILDLYCPGGCVRL